MGVAPGSQSLLPTEFPRTVSQPQGGVGGPSPGARTVGGAMVVRSEPDTLAEQSKAGHGA